MEHELNPLEVIEKKLAEAIAQSVQLSKEIEALQQAVKVLKPIYADFTDHFHVEMEDVIGITDAVRVALRVSGEKLTAPQVRDAIASRGFNLGRYTNAMATIHQVLRRLVDARQVQSESVGESKATYQWIAGHIGSPNMALVDAVVKRSAQEKKEK